MPLPLIYNFDMTTTKRETRPYSFYNKFGKIEYMYVAYDLVFRDSVLDSVYNSAHGSWGHSIDRNSEVWEYFDKKYNQ
jgi:hypothetical protein